jgi:hypothetical protein
MRGNSSYLLEKKDSRKKYKSVAVLKNKSIVIYVLYQEVAATNGFWYHMNLTDNEDKVILNKGLFRAEDKRLATEESIAEYLSIIESESPMLL